VVCDLTRLVLFLPFWLNPVVLSVEEENSAIIRVVALLVKL